MGTREREQQAEQERERQQREEQEQDSERMQAPRTMSFGTQDETVSNPAIINK